MAQETTLDAYQALRSGDVDRATSILLVRVAQNDPQAMMLLSDMYMFGQGVERDVIQAVTLIQDSAKLGYIPAQHSMAWFFIKGQYFDQDLERGLEILTYIADSGYPPAQHDVGMMYAFGDYYAEDISRGLDYLEKAAEQGVSNALLTLAV